MPLLPQLWELLSSTVPYAFAPKLPFLLEPSVFLPYWNSCYQHWHWCLFSSKIRSAKKRQGLPWDLTCLFRCSYQKDSLNGPGLDEETCPSTLLGAQLTASFSQFWLPLAAHCSFIDCLGVTCRSGSICASRSTSQIFLLYCPPNVDTETPQHFSM